MYKTVLIFIKIHVSQGPGYKGITESGQLPGENFPAEQYCDPFIRLVVSTCIMGCLPQIRNLF